MPVFLQRVFANAAKNIPMRIRHFLTAILAMTTVHPMAAQTAQLSIDTTNTAAPINPYIYGQFIEHLGRCIYGGIWAEMLEDRKFYFEVTDTYAPYAGLKDTDYPVVGASPWEMVGSSEGVKTVTQDTFVGKHSLRLRSGSGIRQHDLGVVAGKEYTGYIWVKSTGEARLRVTLSSGGKDETVTLDCSNDDFEKLPFAFTAPATSDKATLEIFGEKGELVIGTLSLMPADNVEGMRADTLELLKELGGTIYRWPGGNFTSGYDWHDGIGDRDHRPPRKNPAWTGVEHNDFGTDEFLAFCRIIDAEPMIASNTGFGDAYCAAQWVQYCNGSADTLAGSWRAKNGNPEPYGVTYWCVGNEMFGPWQLGFMSLSQYQIKHNMVAEAMLEQDPTLQLAAVGAFGIINTDNDPEQAKSGLCWSTGMLMNCADDMHLISEHFYKGRLPWDNSERYPLAEAATQLKEGIRHLAEGHRKLQASLPNLNGRVIPITMDEWNYWHREYTYGELGCAYDMADALGVAEGLHEYFRQSDIVQMAFYAQTVNVIGAIKTSRTAAQMETTGLVLELYRKHFGSVPLKLETDFGPLDIVAALSEDGKTLTIGIVNPTPEAKTIALSLKESTTFGIGTSWSVSAPSEHTRNEPGKERIVDIERADGINAANGLTVQPLSTSVFAFPL